MCMELSNLKATKNINVPQFRGLGKFLARSCKNQDLGQAFPNTVDAA